MPGAICLTGPMRPWTRGLALLLLTALVGLGVGVLPASAHSRLLSITPKDGSSLPAAPSEIVLTFNEEVNPQFVTVRVTDGEGTTVAGEDATAKGSVVTLPVSEPLSAGPYKVTFRVVSADSHPISGATTFTVEGDAQSSPTAGSASPSVPSTATSPSTSTPAASPAPSTTDAAADTDAAGSDGPPALVWFVLGAGVLAALAGAAVALRRSRQSA